MTRIGQDEWHTDMLATTRLPHLPLLVDMAVMIHD